MNHSSLYKIYDTVITLLHYRKREIYGLHESEIKLCFFIRIHTL